MRGSYLSSSAGNWTNVRGWAQRPDQACVMRMQGLAICSVPSTNSMVLEVTPISSFSTGAGPVGDILAVIICPVSFAPDAVTGTFNPLNQSVKRSLHSASKAVGIFDNCCSGVREMVMREMLCNEMIEGLDFV